MFLKYRFCPSYTIYFENEDISGLFKTPNKPQAIK